MNARELFWQLAEPLMAKKGVEESTMMGFPCLRINGNFFAMVDEKRDALIVKLSADRVTDVIDEGLGEPFAPAGKVFKEWVLVPEVHELTWQELIEEARDFGAAS